MTMRLPFRSPVFDYLRASFRGIAQVFLQENAWTGVLLLIGIAVNLPAMALGAALGAGAATLLASGFDDKEGWTRGLYGFNGALTGAAMLAFLGPHPGAWGLAVIGAAWTAVMVRIWGRVCALPVYTAPFVLSTWALLYAANILGLPAASDPGPGLVMMTELDPVLRGVGQVFFQGSAWSGIIFLIALLIHSRRAAGCAALASALGMACAHWSDLPMASIAMGLYGFNAVLTAEALRIALPGRYGFPQLLGVVLSVFMTHAFLRVEMLCLTSPFVLSTWALVVIARSLRPGIMTSGGTGR